MDVRGMQRHNLRHFGRIFSFVASVFLVALGFNTIDFMVNVFAWSPPIDGTWHMNTWFVWDFWNCYMLFGIIPLIAGSILLGWLLRSLRE